MLEARFEKRFAGFSLNVELTAGNETLALLGASGAGKTMTLQCIAGVVKPDRGYIAVDGQVWFDSRKHINLPPQERGVGLLFQNYALFPNMTVQQNLLCGLRHSTPRHQRESEVARLVSAFCLNGLENRLPSQLSGGQQQRVALARCLARKPAILLLDEPFAALDAHLRWRLMQELGATLAAFSGTALYVTHDRDETRSLCQRVCVMSGGCTQQTVETQCWYHTPATRSAALLAGFENVADVTACENGMATIGEWPQSLPCLHKGAVAVAFRAAEAQVCRSREGTVQEGFAVRCRIVRSTEQETICQPLDNPDALIRAKPAEGLTAGEHGWVCVPDEKLVWLSREE